MSLLANEEWCFLRQNREGNATMPPQGFETDFWKHANSVRIDIWLFDGLETARPGRQGRQRDKSPIRCYFGLSSTAFQKL
jgi:hypothetical protein